MMLWDLIRDFIVAHITGGVTSTDEVYSTYFASAMNEYSSLDGNVLRFQVGYYNDGNNTPFYISISDWLATTLTIISLIFILVACVMFVVKMVKLVGNLVK